MSASEHGGGGGSETGTPYVSLKRTYMILLIVYGLGAVFALLAGAALTWHVDPYSECLLYSHPVGDRIEYGHEASRCQVLFQNIFTIFPFVKFVRRLLTCILAVSLGLSPCSTSRSNTEDSS